jgi:hypothetical protein
MSNELEDRKKYYFSCPRCRSNEAFSLPAEDSSGLGCVFFFFGGIIPALIYSDRQSRKIQCDSCGYIFCQPSLPRTGAEILGTSILLCYVAAVATSFVFLVFPEIMDVIPQPEFVKEFAQVISQHIEFFVILVGATAMVTLCLCLVVSITSGIVKRSRLSKKYLLQPKKEKYMPKQPKSTLSQGADCESELAKTNDS